MEKSSYRGRVKLSGWCLKCSNARKRRQERERASAPRSEDGAIVEPVAESDPWPAQQLVEMMREDRDHWQLAFADAWSEDLRVVLDGISSDGEREDWQDAFESTRAAWEAAWSGEPGPGDQLSPELVSDPSGGLAALEVLARPNGDKVPS